MEPGLLTKEEAEREVQVRLAELARQFEAIRQIADQHKIEFSFMGGTMHYRSYYDYGRSSGKHLARKGLFVSDAEWESSGFTCENDDFWIWYRENWPEEFDER